MKNKITRSLIVLVLLCVTAVTLMSFCACQKDGDTQPSGDLSSGDTSSGYQPRLDIPKYDIIYNNLRRVYIKPYAHSDSIVENWDYTHEIKIASSLSDLEKFNVWGTSYPEEYFENNVIMLIMFQYASSDDYSIEFVNIAVKYDKFYPIFATNAPIQDAFTADVRCNLYMVEVDKKVLDYEFEDILVINRRDVNFGSCYHKSITSVFE